jgi:hypothetical protein
MEKIEYNYKIDGRRDTHVDALCGELIFEYKNSVKDNRVFQSSLIRLSSILADLPNHIGILILDETKISKLRLREEWDNYVRLVQPNIISRLKMVVLSKNEVYQRFGDFSKFEIDIVLEIHKTLIKNDIHKKIRKPDAFFEILRILIIQWFRGNGPIQVNKLCQLSGFSYPSVSSSLEKMELQLKRHSNRSIELITFPQDLWYKLLASKDNLRTPQEFWAHRPRDIEYLKNKIINNINIEVGFGGIIGARHYLPSIDLLGTPRLDLTVQKWNKSKIENFVRSLDPGLKRVQPGELPQLVIHNLFRPDPLFINDDNTLFADEVECLLDLQELRLEQQASELLEYFKKTRKNE